MSAELACTKYELQTCVPVMKMVCGGRSRRAGTVFEGTMALAMSRIQAAS